MFYIYSISIIPKEIFLKGGVNYFLFKLASSTLTAISIINIFFVFFLFRSRGAGAEINYSYGVGGHNKFGSIDSSSATLLFSFTVTLHQLHYHPGTLSVQCEGLIQLTIRNYAYCTLSVIISYPFIILYYKLRHKYGRCNCIHIICSSPR